MLVIASVNSTDSSKMCSFAPLRQWTGSWMQQLGQTAAAETMQARQKRLQFREKQMLQRQRQTLQGQMQGQRQR